MHEEDEDLLNSWNRRISDQPDVSMFHERIRPIADVARREVEKRNNRRLLMSEDYLVKQHLSTQYSHNQYYAPELHTRIKRSSLSEKAKSRHKISKTSRKFISVAIVADASVIRFHGNKVEQFLLNLMNIVSAIYSDPSLGSKISIVVTNVALVEDEKESKILQGNSRVSLENVCEWFKNMNYKKKPERRHDVGIFLTRQDIGGPAGFAPVGGICNYARSCALIRDEGLTSAFIIAHEMGHILGLTHDGDEDEGNTCHGDADEGSVMAPLVVATFTRFRWSSCSRKELRSKLNAMFCLNEDPLSNAHAPANLTLHPNSVGKSYSLDEQCRLEFGDGFHLCRSYMLSDPCTHLWCSNKSSPLICKTKKGPPLEGTPCGRGKWCAKGFCQPINRKAPMEPIQHNPQHGGWSRWSRYGDCSRSCGGGIKFRTRTCNNPKPAYGGKPCVGVREQFAICRKQACPQPADFRAEQCRHLPHLLPMDSRKAQLTWRPSPTMMESMHCKLVCVAEETREVYKTEENVIDGTLCNYDVPHHVCVQGKCQPLGCDKIFGSNKTEDACGVCEGTGQTCKNVHKVFVRTPSRANRSTRVTVIPRGARKVEIKEVSKTANYVVLHSRKFGTSELNTKKRTSASFMFVWVGTKFVFTRNTDSETITARGPLLDDVVVTMVPVVAGLHTMITVNFTVATKRKKDSILSRLPRQEFYYWKVVGWSRCSRSCGGGEQYTKFACRDRRSESAVGKRLCAHLEKPMTKRKMCNTFSCTYRWQTGDWEHCTRSCGSQGTQLRLVHCVPENETQTIVSPSFCRDGKPEETRPCNHIPCPSHWFSDEWSPCSATCGHGVQARNVTCIPPENEIVYDCPHSDKPEHIRECYSTSMCPGGSDCEEDASEFCSVQVLHRYCQIPSYRRLCCRSCASAKSSRTIF